MKRNVYKVINRELYSGLFILLVLIIISIFGPSFAPYDPDFSETIRKVVINGEKEYVFAPEKPGERHLLGTDEWGYDTLTMLLYGARYTLCACFFVTLIRISLGAGIGLLRGLKGKPSKKFESTGGIPVFVILFFFFYNLNFNPVMPTLKLFFIQVVVIALSGLTGVIVPVQHRTWEISCECFIEAAKSIGAGTSRIILKHIIPHQRDFIFQLTVTEMIHALNLIGQLGIFYYFIGGTIMTQDPSLLQSITKEWAGIIGQYRNSAFSKPWILFAPLTAYLIVLSSFHLISQGLEKHCENKYSRFPHV